MIFVGDIAVVLVGAAKREIEPRERVQKFRCVRRLWRGSGAERNQQGEDDRNDASVPHDDDGAYTPAPRWQFAKTSNCSHETAALVIGSANGLAG